MSEEDKKAQNPVQSPLPPAPQVTPTPVDQQPAALTAGETSQPCDPVASMTHEEKMVLAIQAANLSPAILDELGDIKTLVATMAVVSGALLAIAATGYGAVVEAVAGLLLIAGAAMTGIQIGSGINSMIDFYQKTGDATTTEELNDAGKSFADGVAKLGVGGLNMVLTVLGGRGKPKTKMSHFDDGAKKLNDLHNSEAGLRQRYTDSVRGLKEVGEDLLRQGLPKEDVARRLHETRRQLGVQFKEMTPPELLEYIHKFNTYRYGDKLGPTFESLISKGKTFDQIIESASHPLGDAKQLGAALHKHFGDDILPILRKYDMLPRP